MRVKAVVAYDGSEFQGFQQQTLTNNTVSFAIQKALNQVGIDTQIVASGRTDSKVHATGQIIHFDIPEFWHRRSTIELKYHINSKLDAVKFKHIATVNDDFHARYDAKERVYRYIFKKKPSVFERKYISKLSIKEGLLFQKALSLYIGRHNFVAFKKSGSYTKSDIREVKKAYLIQRKDYNFVYFHADGFLRSQVRLMLSGAVAVANGDIGLSELKEQLYTGKSYIRKPAPPEGLYLARVIYNFKSQ